MDMVIVDTVQDIQGIIHLAPEMAVDKIRFMLSAQVDNGGGLPLVKFTHNAGHEDTPDDVSYVKETGHPAYRADDALWLFPTVYKYISESGNLSFVDEVIPFANKGEGTVYEHLKRAVEFSLNHMGPHGMPAGRYADWNDCLRLGKNGESTFVALQFYLAMTILKKFAEYKGDTEYIAYLEEKQEKLGGILNKLCWNEDRFIRGFTEEGEVIGNREAPEANMWLNPQSWSVISGFASESQAEKALEKVYENLNTEYERFDLDHIVNTPLTVRLLLFIMPEQRKNAGIFSHLRVGLFLQKLFLVMETERLCILKKMLLQHRMTVRKSKTRAILLWTVYRGKGKSTLRSLSYVHWLTGTASTVMVGCVGGNYGNPS